MIGYKLLPVVVAFNGLVPMVFAVINYKYTFGLDCSVSIEHVNEDVTATLVYNGEELKSWCDQMSFIGRDDDYLNEYKVCVTPIVYKDPYCAVELKYKNDYSGGLKATFDCYNQPVEQFCGDQDDYFYVELKETKGNSRGLSSVHIELKVEAVMVLDYYQRVGIIVGSVIGGIVLLCCCCVCCYYNCRETKPSASTSGQVVTFNSAAEPLTQTNPGPTVNPGTYYYSPQSPGNQPNQYQTNYSTAYAPSVEASAPPMSDYTQPPPSYESVTKMQ